MPSHRTSPTRSATSDALGLATYVLLVGSVDFVYDSISGYSVVCVLLGLFLSGRAHVAFSLLALAPLASIAWLGFELDIGYYLGAQGILAVALVARGWLVCSLDGHFFRARVLRRYGVRLRTILFAFAIGYVLWACLIRGAVLKPLGFAVVLFLIRGALPGGDARRSLLDLRGIATNGVVLVVASGFALGLLEVGSRTLIDSEPYQSDLFEFHPEAIMTLQANSEGTLRLELAEGGVRVVEVVHSSQGLREGEIGAKRPGEYRILMLGDSYTWGMGLENDETIVRQLDGLIEGAFPDADVTIINAGVGGYSPWQERIFLGERGFPLEPDLVILQLYPANDVPDSLIQFDEYLETYNEEWRRRILIARYDGGFVPSLERWLRSHSRAYQLLADATGDRLSVTYFASFLRAIPQDALPRLPHRADRPHTIEVNRSRDYPMLEKAWSTFAEDITGIAADCAEHGVEFVVYGIPSKEETVDELWKRHMTYPTISAADYDRTLVDGRLMAMATERGWRFVDLAEMFRAHPAPADLYFMRDGHLKPEGARFVSEALLGFLRSRAGELGITE